MSEISETLKRRTPAEPQGEASSRTSSTTSSAPAVTTAVEDRIPQHPYMAANGRSNVHCDPFMSDTYEVAGPVNDKLYLRTGAARPNPARSSRLPARRRRFRTTKAAATSQSPTTQSR